jgi:hypothetical protein
LDTSVTAWNELYQIETFLTPKTVVPGAESACRRIAGSGRGKIGDDVLLRFWHGVPCTRYGGNPRTSAGGCGFREDLA